MLPADLRAAPVQASQFPGRTLQLFFQPAREPAPAVRLRRVGQFKASIRELKKGTDVARRCLIDRNRFTGSHPALTSTRDSRLERAWRAVPGGVVARLLLIQRQFRSEIEETATQTTSPGDAPR